MPTMNIQISFKFHAICAASSVVIIITRLGTERDIIESVDSISKDERGFPLTQYITNG